MPDYVVGRNPVLECLRAGRRTPHRLLILKDAKSIEPLIVAARAAGVPVHTCLRHELDRLLPGETANHQGVILEAEPLPLLDPGQWLATPIPADAVAVILDGIEDPHNFGAIVRSAAACGAAAVVFGKDRAAPVSPAAIKSAAGGMEHVALVCAGNLVRALDQLKRANFWIVALDAAASQSLWDVDLTGRVGLVVGSEGRGIRRLVAEHCDFHARIPLPGRITSLNASVSAGIALAECLRRRRVSPSQQTE